MIEDSNKTKRIDLIVLYYLFPISDFPFPTNNDLVFNALSQAGNRK